jgi:hypothetical protein
MVAAKFPCETKQGIFLAKQGIDLKEQGISGGRELSGKIANFRL